LVNLLRGIGKERARIYGMMEKTMQKAYVLKYPGRIALAGVPGVLLCLLSSGCGISYNAGVHAPATETNNEELSACRFCL
jgi:hypothetical protein